MTFASPYFLLLLLLIVPYVLWYFLFRKRHEGALTLATTETFRNAPRTWRNRLIHLPFFLRLFCFVAVVLVMARPQTSHSWNKDETEGIHIVLAMDISTSMLMQDIAPNRITAAKDVATEFVNHRPSDNIGLTLFGGEAFTQCPLTTDHGMLLRALGNASCELQGQGLIQPGTAIGMGLASAVAHVEKAEGKSKVVVLLTDGANNTGDISPLMAADMAKDCGVRVYTILLGSEGKVNVPVATLPNGEVYTAQTDATPDPATLKEIAATTGGIFYRATSRTALREVYNDIDRLEKTKLKVNNYSRRYEAFQPFAFAALLFLLLEMVLRLTWLRKGLG